jgi:flagellar biosynthetic protein FliR
MLRFQGFFLMSPIFSRNDIPAIVKIGLSAVFSFVLYEFIFPLAYDFIPTQPVSLSLAIFHELLIGMMLGLMCNLIFDAITTLTHLVGIQSGMSSSNVFNPVSNSTTNAMGVFYVTVALLFFLSFDGLYHLIFILRKSFEIIPLASFTINFSALAENYVEIFNTVFIIAMKFTLPILALMFVVDVFVALFAKILPQANIFFLVMPNKIFFAVFVITSILGGFYIKFQEYFDSQIYDLFDQLFT